MIPKIIFDLSEVLILGLVGIEKQLSSLVSTPENEILKCFGGQLLEEVCSGNISEDTYLQQIVANQQWDIQPETLKMVIRNNFHQEIEGTVPVLMNLSAKHELVLLSDHAREWVSYIKTIHPFLSVFEQTFFSYELGKTKKNPHTFLEVLERMTYSASECLLIDDSPRNIEMAASVGISGIQFADAQQLHKALVDRQIL
jgi:HAD superfamily hydrolase (TIGR01509 family)